MHRLAKARAEPAVLAGGGGDVLRLDLARLPPRAHRAEASDRVQGHLEAQRRRRLDRGRRPPAASQLGHVAMRRAVRPVTARPLLALLGKPVQAEQLDRHSPQRLAPRRPAPPVNHLLGLPHIAARVLEEGVVQLRRQVGVLAEVERHVLRAGAPAHEGVQILPGEAKAERVDAQQLLGGLALQRVHTPRHPAQHAALVQRLRPRGSEAHLLPQSLLADRGDRQRKAVLVRQLGEEVVGGHSPQRQVADVQRLGAGDTYPLPLRHFPPCLTGLRHIGR
mmetsp:Transcript_45197/g.146873  ORF Transcript_45197/g.146873 Transcript_45197/m.146873 type:complete len:278 (-) Transcript_45197:457-1290(-)